MGTENLKSRIAYLQANLNHWCPVVSSKAIKIVIIDRCDKIGVSLAEVCASCDVKYKPVKSYWVEMNDALSRPNLRAQDIMKIAEKLGIDIRTLAVVKDIEKVKREDILKGLDFIRG